MNQRNVASINIQNQLLSCNRNGFTHCHLHVKYFTKVWIFQAQVRFADGSDVKFYIRLTGNTFKNKHTLHSHSFCKPGRRNTIFWFQYIRRLKNKHRENLPVV